MTMLFLIIVMFLGVFVFTLGIGVIDAPGRRDLGDWAVGLIVMALGILMMIGSLGTMYALKA